MAQIGRCDRCKDTVEKPSELMSKIVVYELLGNRLHNDFKEAIELCIPCTTQLSHWLKEPPPRAIESGYRVKV